MIDDHRNSTTRPNSSVTITAILLVTCLVVTAVGCGQSAGGVGIQGQVTFRNESVTNASLVFFPTKGRPTTAVLSADGTYSCQLSVGEYRVTVTLGAQLPQGWKEGDPIPPRAMQLPKQYSSRGKTPLRANVSTGQNQPIDFVLD